MGLLQVLALSSLATVGYSADVATSSYKGLSTSAISRSSWSALNATLQGKLHSLVPLAAPCFDTVDGLNTGAQSSACKTVEAGYREPFWRSLQPDAYTWPQWESCLSKRDFCTLNPSLTNDSSAWTGKTCEQGSVSEYYVEVGSYKDVQVVFDFVRKTGVLVSIKNSGHDFGGRGSLEGSLNLWTRTLGDISYNPKFVPSGGKKSTPALTVGAGTSWYDVYTFCEKHNLTAIGGYHPTVGASGGWLMGGGHSILSPVYGLGVDRVLEFKVVTPDGVYRTANAYKNPDLFWALRGGGGGTFGVVLESTMMVEPQMKLQVAYLTFTQTADNARGWLELVIDNTLKWGKEGWGGHITPHDLLSVTPLLSTKEANQSMTDLVAYALAQGGTAVVEEVPSWLTFFDKYVSYANSVGLHAVGGSWLVPTDMFESEPTKEQILDAIMPMVAYANPHITTATPYLFKYEAGSTSAAPAWRNSIWHTVFQYAYTYNATTDDTRKAFQTITDNIQLLRDIAPNSGAYGNEADMYDPDHERAFWGDNYPRLLELKNQYDPDHLLDCWYCVGWRGASNSRFECYLSE